MTFPHAAAIKASTKADGKWTYSTTGSTPCFLQPMDAESVQLYGVTYAKGAVCYLPDTANVEEGMRLIIGGETYGVRGIKELNYGTLQHKKAVVEKV